MLPEWWNELRLKIRALLMRRQLDRDLEDELQFHLAMREEKNKASGLPAPDARESALRKFGNAASLKERCREMWMLMSLETIWRDLRYAARSFLKTPGFTLVVVLVMAFGIGANTALFTVVHAVLLRPLPFVRPDRLVSLYERNVIGDYDRNVVSGGVFEYWQKEAKSFVQMSVLGEDGANLSGSAGQLPEYIDTRLCTHEFFPMLGVQPMLGRFFSADDDRSQANATAVLTYSLWKRRFAADPTIIGKTILLDSKLHTVIGVLPAYFIYPEARTELWLPVYNELPAQQMHFLGNHRFYVWARLKPGVTVRQAYAELDAIQHRLLHDQPDAFVGKGTNVIPLQFDLAHKVQSSLYLLLMAVGCVLLIACLNVASLFVARAASRRREIAIRASLGAGRSRLLVEQLVGSLLLTGLGGALGVLLAFAGLRWILTAREDLPGAAAIHIDATVLLFALALTSLSGIFAGFFPAFSATGQTLLGGLQEASRTVAGGHSRLRLRKVLLAAEVTLTVILLVGAGLLLKSFAKLQSVNMGCATDNVLTLSLSLPDSRYSTAEQKTAFFSQLLDGVRAMPGVSAAGFVNVLPGEGHYVDNTFTIPGHPPLPPGQSLDAVLRDADPDYFRAMGIRLIRGRFFTERERLDHAKVVILSESMAQKYFPGEDSVGKYLTVDLFDHPPLEIVGIVADVRSWLDRPVEPTMYIPLYRGLFEYGSLVVRSSKDVTSLALPIQRLIARMDSDLAVSDVLTMDQIIAKSTADAKFSATLVLLFAALALVLAAVGLYGVLSYLVSQRTNEIGIRIALGAQRSAVMHLMLLDGVRPAAIGLILGVIGGAFSARLIQSELFGVQPLDASVFAAVVFLVVAVATASCLFPAWRASRLDPLLALRCE
jgi:predicted permease